MENDFLTYTEMSLLNSQAKFDEFDELVGKGFIWKDKIGKEYKIEEITTEHLQNIIPFAKINDYPNEQIQVLENELERRLKNGK